ncbi:DUF397 domain-containing protein [Streptomyces sp. M2CJ-2]|uniref:DUF397 domain-containing protein n=1 Tax=Streptomyces sp. M2CJ-2 TaxID=2803948 RepID=UPI001920C9EA|nr:DUF397 domain-containing protein [Streptomyces sp. M2CJ-2]MBL3666214.1 DUF397 domain-containing protein [Streptomyces sp. M2CJ-2]
MNTEQLAQLTWLKSSYSGDEGGECVEVAPDATAIHVRDSKEHDGPQLAFPRSVWSGFVASLGRNRI